MAVPVMKNVTIARYMVNESVAHTIEVTINNADSFLGLFALLHNIKDNATKKLATDISGPSNRKPSISAKIGEAT